MTLLPTVTGIDIIRVRAVIPKYSLLGESRRRSLVRLRNEDAITVMSIVAGATAHTPLILQLAHGAHEQICDAVDGRFLCAPLLPLLQSRLIGLTGMFSNLVRVKPRMYSYHACSRM